MNLYQYTLNNPINGIDPFGLATYYIKNKMDTSTPTNNIWSHSFVAIIEKDPVTGKEKVVKTFSWVNTGGGMLEDSSKKQNLEGAQKAIDSGTGATKKGDDSLDPFVVQEFENRKYEMGGFWLFDGSPYQCNCKQQAVFAKKNFDKLYIEKYNASMLALLQKFLNINQGGHMAAINKVDLEKLLGDQRIIDEINRHLWIESEKAGHDIGFEQAKADWFKKFSKSWISYNMPELVGKEAKGPAAPKYKETQAAKPAVAQKRRAKSYL